MWEAKLHVTHRLDPIYIPTKYLNISRGNEMIYLFVLILYIPVNIFPSCWDRSSWDEQVLSRG